MNMNKLFDEFLTTQEKKPLTNPVTNTYSLPGRGRKQCPECNTYVGVRAKVCKCGYVFPKTVASNNNLKSAIEKVNEEKATPEERALAFALGFQDGVFVHAIGNPPLVKLVDVTYPSICQFVEQTIDKGMANHKMYTPSAIKHVLGHKLGFNSQDYKRACTHVDTWVKSIINRVE